MDDLAQTLRQVWHFRTLNLADLRMIVRAGQLRRFDEGTVIFQGGAPAAGMFVLFRGKVHLCRTSPTGQEQILSVIEPVIMFNELTAIDGGSNPFTAVAVVDCLTWNIDEENFHALVRRYPNPDIGLALLRVLAARTRGLIDRCEDLSFKPVLARTAKLLLEVSKDGKRVINRRDHPIRELSARVATVPEAISRSLSIMKECGCIECTRSYITILDPEALAETAHMGTYLTHE
jgi:CRP/FNR family transcriptional regulator